MPVLSNILIFLWLTLISATAKCGSQPMEFSIMTLLQAISEGRLTSEGLVRGALAKQQEHESLNAFITLDTQGALAQARYSDQLSKKGIRRGLLHGLPIVVKDNIHVAGLPNTAGTPLLRNFVPKQDAEVVKRLKDAGAIILGKTNMHELAYGITSNNYAFGAVCNAVRQDHIAGGSSGGTAVAVAAGITTIGLGTDTGGSSRIPAALNGLVGFRPTTGRYPSDGLTSISFSRDTVGPIARTVGDILVLDSVLSGTPRSHQKIKLSGLRLGVPRHYFYDNLEPAVAQATENLLQLLSESGVELIEADLEQVAELNEKVGFPIVIYETGTLLKAYLRENMPEETLGSLVQNIASPDVKNIMTMVINGEAPESTYRKAIDHYRPQLQQAYRDYFSSYGVEAIIFPTTPLTARPIENSLETVELNGEYVPTFPTYIRNTDPASNAGIPGLSLPLAVSAGELPIGIEIDGPERSDQRLLAIGAAIEALIKQQNNNDENRNP